MILLDEYGDNAQQSHAYRKVWFVQRSTGLLRTGLTDRTIFDVGRKEFDDQSADTLLKKKRKFGVLKEGNAVETILFKIIN